MIEDCRDLPASNFFQFFISCFDKETSSGLESDFFLKLLTVNPILVFSKTFRVIFNDCKALNTPAPSTYKYDVNQKYITKELG